MINLLTVTDTGLRRQTNQDALACSAPGEQPVWAVVCDGMGGHAGGHIAAQLACSSLAKVLGESLRPDMGERSLHLLLETAIENANSAIHRQAQAQPELQGMGTTIVAAVVQQNRLFLCHAGDSRAYLLRQGVAKAVTRDHSVVQQLVDRGEITPRQAKTHPERHLITKALGVADQRVAPVFGVFDLQPGDRVLLCTDGLHGLVEHSELPALCEAAIAAQNAACLAERANQLGGSDNISAILLYGF